MYNKAVHCTQMDVYVKNFYSNSEMYVAAGEYMKAVEIMGENGWVDRSVSLSKLSTPAIMCLIMF